MSERNATIAGTPATSDSSDTAEPFNVSRGQLIYATLLIALISMLSSLDRFGISILVQPIKAEMGFSDTQIGLITGFAFSLTFAMFAIPLARIADTRNRVWLLSVCLAVWSVATALAGLATNFVQMVLSRAFVGVAEAGGSPTSMSMLGDYYPPKTRPRGMSLYLMGGILGGSVGMAAVGTIAGEYGWRTAFFFMGLPGLAVVLLVLFTLREPTRGRFQSTTFNTDVNWWQAVRDVLHRRTMRHLLAAFTILTIGTSGSNAWLGAFLMRSHELTLSEAGSLLGAVIGVGTLVGTVLSVLFAPWLIGRDRRWELWWPGVTNLLYVPLFLVAVYVDSIMVAGIALITSSILVGSSLGMILASVQSVLPAHIRATGIAVVTFAVNSVAAGSGPLLIGIASDALSLRFGDDGLRYALMFGSLFVAWGVLHFFLGAKYLRGDLIE